MTYKIKTVNGDTVAVPQLVISCLNRTSGENIRVALYILSSGSLDARDIAHALSLKSVRTAEEALHFWAGAGLLIPEKAPTSPLARPVSQSSSKTIDFASLRDPMVATLVEETQNYMGKTLGSRDINRLVGLYLQEDFPVEVILLCAARIALRGKTSVVHLEHELFSWRQAGVETGAQAESYMQLLDERQRREARVAELFGMEETALTLADRRTIRRWYEEMNQTEEMIAEAILQAQDKKTIRYVNGILKAWKSRGLLTVQQVRGGGTLDTAGSAALRVDRNEHSGHDILQRRPGTGLRLKRED